MAYSIKIDGAWKDDENKPRMDLLPAYAMVQLGRVLTFGARKYAPNGWRDVPQARERYHAALLRHLFCWADGERTDPESGLPHLAHVLCNAAFLVELERVQESRGGAR